MWARYGKTRGCAHGTNSLSLSLSAAKTIWPSLQVMGARLEKDKRLKIETRILKEFHLQLPSSQFALPGLSQAITHAISGGQEDPTAAVDDSISLRKVVQAADTAALGQQQLWSNGRWKLLLISYLGNLLGAGQNH